jgi:hypothetical protein
MALGEIAAGIQGVGAIGGLLGGKRSNRQADKSQAAARDILGIQSQAMRTALAEATRYDPVKSDKAAMDLANEQAGAALDRTIRGLNARYAQSGGNPAGDTAHQMAVGRAANDIWDPVRSQFAMRAADAPLRRIEALMGAVGSGRGLASDYLAMSDRQRVDPTGAAMALGGAIDQFTGKRAKGKRPAKKETAGSLGIYNLGGVPDRGEY